MFNISNEDRLNFALSMNMPKFKVYKNKKGPGLILLKINGPHKIYFPEMLNVEIKEGDIVIGDIIYEENTWGKVSVMAIVE